MESSKQRFSSLKVFKFNAQGGGKPPPVPPKDNAAAYPFARSLAASSSTASLGRSTDNLHSFSAPSQPESPATSYQNHSQSQLSVPSSSYAQSTYSQQQSYSDGERGRYQERDNGGFRKSIMKLTSLSRKPFNRQPSASTMAALREDEPDPPPLPTEDPGISIPWGFQHHVHVTEDFSGMPQSWAESLAAQGLSEAEIHQLQQRRMQQQQQLANGQPGGSISPVSSLNGHGRLIRPPERQGSLPMSEDPHSSSSYHSPNGSVIMPGLNGYFPSPVTNGHGSRPASPARRGGTPQPTPIRTTGPLQVANDAAQASAVQQMSPPPSYSADAHGPMHRLALDDSKTRTATPPHDRTGTPPYRTATPTQHSRTGTPVQRTGTPTQQQQRTGTPDHAFERRGTPEQRPVRTAPPDRPIPQPPASGPPVHSNESSGSGIDVGGLLMNSGDNSEDEELDSRRSDEEDEEDGDDVRSDEQDPGDEEDELEDEDRDDRDGDDKDSVPALPTFKLPALPPRLSLHQDSAGGLGDFDFTDSLFSSLAPDTLLTLSSLSSPAPDTSPPPHTRPHPPVIIERPPSMFPESPNPSPGLTTPGTAGVEGFGSLRSPAPLDSAGTSANLTLRSPSPRSGAASPSALDTGISAVSGGAFSIADFPMPPPLPPNVDSRPSSPLLSPGATRRAPSPLSQPSVVIARQDSDSPSSSGGRNGVVPRSPAYSEFSRDSSGSLALLSEPPSPAPVAIATVTTVAKRAVAKEIQSPASATASGRDSPASAGSGSASPARVPGGPFSPVKGPLVNVVTSAASGSRPSTANSPVASRVQSPPSISRPSTAPTSTLSPTAHRPPPLKLGLDVSSERLAVQLQRSPDPRDPRGQPAESPTTAILSQLVSQHLPPSPVKPSPSTARPSPQQPSASASRPPGAQHTRSASSISRKPVPPIVPPAPALQRQPSEDESPSALDEWLEGEEEADRIKDNEDEDVISAESVLDAWLNGNNADDSATSPAESPQQQQPSKPLPPPSHPPPARPPPAPPRTALPATPGSARHDVPVLRVDTAAPPTASTLPQQRPFPHVTAAQAASLAPAPPAPWLQGSPSTDARPVYLPAELEPLRELIHLNTNARALFGELVLVAQGQYGDVYAVNNGGPPCALKIAPLYIAAPLTPASAATTSAASTPGHHTFDELGNLRAVKVSPKMAMLKHELVYIGRMRHEHVLGMDALYFVDDSLWIKMELMVRSLADLVGLCGELFGDKDGEEFTLREREVARFAADTLEALKYIESLGVAHRDVRSDNLLLNGQGVVKLADFSHAVKRIEGEAFVCRDIVGVAYWRAAEINTGPYDPMRVDVWSLGATVWELMEAEPPFERTKQLAHRWPPLERARGSSTALQDFLHWCSDPPSTRPSAAALLQTPWIKSACSRGQVVELLERARQLEESLALDADEEDEDS